MLSQSLEQQALDRVARMYSSYDRRPHSRPAPEPNPEPDESPRPEPEARDSAAEDSKPTGLLDILLKDKEQSLIMLLLVILMKDGADLNLILALMYLLIE